MSIFSLLLNAVLPVTLLCAAPATAGVKALLVGVSDYHHLDADLMGPRNDVRLMAGALMDRGVAAADIRILTTPGTPLAEGLAPAADPTRVAILAALDQLAAGAGPEDSILFYYSGHGSLAPDQNGDEPDGFDQILLPSDVTGWNGAAGFVENAIADDELALRLQAILDSGAQLIGILDACHSATGFRDVGGMGVARYVAPQLLGLPGALAEQAADAGPGPVAPALRGNFAFLYSSQSDQRSFEYPLGDRTDPDNWYGDFTRNLVAALTGVPDLTWAQALTAAADGLRQEQARQTPDAEGPGLAQPVFGGAGGAGRLRVSQGRLLAGLLQGVSEGAVYELFDQAAGGASLGLARAVEVGAAGAVLESEAPLPAIAYAALHSPGLPPPLRFGPPLAADQGDYAGAFSILGQIRDQELVEAVRWDSPDFDLRLVAVDGELVLVGRDGAVDPDGPGTAPRLSAGAGADVILGFIDRAVRLHRLNTALQLASTGQRSFGIAGVGLAVRAQHLPVPAAGVCPEAAGEGAPLQAGQPVGQCDQIWLTASNSSKTAQDVTVLYIDRDLNILPIWPEQGLSNRVGFGASVEIGLRIEAGGGVPGREELIVIAVPAREGAPRADLTSLASDGAVRATGGAAPALDWLAAALEPGGQSRSFRTGVKPDPIRITRYPLILSDG